MSVLPYCPLTTQLPLYYHTTSFLSYCFLFLPLNYHFLCSSIFLLRISPLFLLLLHIPLLHPSSFFLLILLIPLLPPSSPFSSTLCPPRKPLLCQCSRAGFGCLSEFTGDHNSLTHSCSCSCSFFLSGVAWWVQQEEGRQDCEGQSARATQVDHFTISSCCLLLLLPLHLLFFPDFSIVFLAPLETLTVTLWLCYWLPSGTASSYS